MQTELSKVELFYRNSGECDPEKPINILYGSNNELVGWGSPQHSDIAETSRREISEVAVGAAMLKDGEFATWRLIANNIDDHTFKLPAGTSEAELYERLKDLNHRIGKMLLFLTVAGPPIVLGTDFADTFVGAPPGIEVVAWASTILPSLRGLIGSWFKVRKSIDNKTISFEFSEPDDDLSLMQDELDSLGDLAIYLNEGATASNLPNGVSQMLSIKDERIRDRIGYFVEGGRLKLVSTLMKNQVNKLHPRDSV